MAIGRAVKQHEARKHKRCLEPVCPKGRDGYCGVTISVPAYQSRYAQVLGQSLEPGGVFQGYRVLGGHRCSKVSCNNGVVLRGLCPNWFVL